MESKIRVEHEDEKWQRYSIQQKCVIIERFLGSKSLRLYNVGKEALERFAALFNVKIEEYGTAKWVKWKDEVTGIEVIVFE